MRSLLLLCWMTVMVISPSFALEIPTKDWKIANLPNVGTVEGDVIPRTDGTVEPTEEMIAEYEKVFNKYLKNKDKYDIQNNYVIPTVVHIVLPSAGSNANEAQGVEQEQVDVLNQAFADNNSPFFFDLVGILTHVDNGWWNDDSDMKSSTRVGDMGTLNIWYNNNNFLGYATFPVGYDNPNDGVVCLHSAVLGGSTTNYDLGATLVHEVGHWIALYHTFQGGCSANGDQVSDTPPEQSPAYGCPIGRDTCSGGGVDPIHNYMDYSDDACMYEFTPLQNDRMIANYLQYRFFGTPEPTTSVVPTPVASPSPTNQPTLTFPPTIACFDVDIEILPDQWADSETTWTLYDTDGTTILDSGGGSDFTDYVLYEYTVSCLPNVCGSGDSYKWVIEDDFGDGLNWSTTDPGYFKVFANDVEVFGSSDGVNFGDSDEISIDGCGDSLPTASPTIAPTAAPTITCVDAGFPVAFTSVGGGTSVPCEFVGGYVSDCLCDDPDVSSHCPVSCESCPTFLCEDSSAVFYVPSGGAATCAYVASLDPVLITEYCALIPDLVSTCRETCGLC